MEFIGKKNSAGRKVNRDRHTAEKRNTPSAWRSEGDSDQLGGSVASRCPAFRSALTLNATENYFETRFSFPTELLETFIP